MQSPSLVLLSDQAALQRSMDVVANNVANANTTGFKREGVEFDTYVSRPEPRKAINFVVDRATYRDAATGPIQTTGNPFDIALQGQGYIPIQMAGGQTGYTRSGSFQVNPQGQLVTQSGLPVLGNGGQAITIPDTATDVVISGDGYITARDGNNASTTELGKIAPVKFDNEQALTAVGGGLYTTAQTPTPSDDTKVVQGALEQSNVQSVTEMTSMIKIMRSYEQTVNLINMDNQRQTDAMTKLSRTTA